LVSLAVLLVNPEAETAEFYKVKASLSVPVRLYQREGAGEIEVFMVASHLKDKIPVGTN
jgi:hypothetical protein